MEFPFISVSSAGAEADCFDCAKQFYESQTHNCAKTIDEVFPNLCAAAQSKLVDPMEFFTPQKTNPIETLRVYLHHCCKGDPSEAYRLIESDVSQVSSLAAARNSGPTPKEQYLETSNNEKPSASFTLSHSACQGHVSCYSGAAVAHDSHRYQCRNRCDRLQFQGSDALFCS